MSDYDVTTADGTRINAKVTIPDDVGYLVYTALVTQSAGGDPEATVIENTIGPLVWARYATGQYTLSGGDGFTLNTFVVSPLVVPSNDVNVFKIFVDRTGLPTNVLIRTVESGGTTTDDMLSDTYFEIRVYP
jgi:hypothetical protein